MTVADGVAFEAGRALFGLAVFVGFLAALFVAVLGWSVVSSWWGRFKRRRDPRWWS